MDTADNRQDQPVIFDYDSKLFEIYLRIVKELLIA